MGRCRVIWFNLAGACQLSKLIFTFFQVIVDSLYGMWNTCAMKYRRYPSPNLPRDGEMPFKRWIEERAKEAGISYLAYWYRLDRGMVPRPKMRRVNKRVIFVKP